jgi:carboxymethylenebutenolidase
MIEKNVTVRTNDGFMPTFIVHPEFIQPAPIVMFYMDALGIRKELLDMARRIAVPGYYVMLANLFYRDGGPAFDKIS